MKKEFLCIILFLVINTSLTNASNKIHLKSRRFTPDKGISAAAKQKIEAIPEKAHVLIQLERIPSIKQRKELEAKGIKLLSYVPDNAWFASIPSAKVGEIAALAQVRAISEILIDDKISPQIRESGVNDYSTIEQGQAKLVVLFFDDVSLDDASSVIEDYSGTVKGKARIINALVVNLPIDAITGLLGEDCVKWINQHYEPAVCNDGSRAAIGVDYVQSAYDLNGIDVVIGQWDEGCVDDTHNDLSGRVTYSGCGSISSHATHVAGTVMGNGYMSDALAGEDCTSCFGSGTPNDVFVTFSDIIDCGDPDCQGDPPDGTYKLAQDDGNPCKWVYQDEDFTIHWVADKDDPQTDNIELRAAGDTGEWFLRSTTECNDGPFTNTHNNCTYNCGRDGNATEITWWLAGDPCQWRGMATKAEVISYESWKDACDMNDNYHDAINNYGIDISQNSWVYFNTYGTYDDYCKSLDSIVVGDINRPITIVWSAGNDGPGYDTIIHPAAAKNIITVGATNSDDDSLWPMSSKGPTDDGRIKPDLVAPGCQYVSVGLDFGIVSTVLYNTYGIGCGTSFSSPAVSGGAALMLQQWRQTHTGQGDPLPSTIKAVLIQTANDDVDGPNDSNDPAGPDYSYGYGLIDVNEAIKLIKADDVNNNDVIIEESVLDQFDRDYYTIDVTAGVNDLRITLVWDDEPGTTNSSKALINDLDLIVTDPNGTRHYPWTLDPRPGYEGNPAETNEPDHLNNVEQVYVNEPNNGIWTIEVKGYSVPEPVQKYSIVTNNLSLIPPEATSHWKFDEGSGTTAADSVGDNDGNIIDADWVTGKIGSWALDFDGSDEYVEISDEAEFDFGSDIDFSISAWIKSTSASGRRRIVNKAESGHSPYTGIEFYMDPGGVVKFRLKDNADKIIVKTDDAVNDGVWHFLAGIADRDANMAIYHNGRLEDSNSLASVDDVNNDVNLAIGRSMDYDGQYFKGTIDDVRIYKNIILSAEEIWQLYRNGLDVAIISHWKFDEGSGTTAADTAGDNDGNIIDANWFNDPNDPNRGRCLVFNGNGDYVEVSNEENFDFGSAGDFSISAWIKTTATTGRRRIVNKAESGHAPYTGIEFYMDPGGVVKCRLKDNADTSIVVTDANTAVNDGTWHLIAAVVDREADLLKLYHNDELEDSNSLALVDNINNNINLGIGRSMDYNGQYFDGKIDDVRIYNIALSREEIEQLYEEGL